MTHSTKGLRYGARLMLLVILFPVAAPAAERGPAAEEFYRLHGEMNALLAELSNLQVEYRTADEDKQSVIRTQWDQRITEGNLLEPKMVEAAEKAYAESPNADPELTRFLVKLLAEKVEGDQYEEAAVLGKLLMENRCPDKHVPNLAGIAAFAVNDVDDAKRYLTQAAEKGYYQSPPKDDKLVRLGAMCFYHLRPEAGCQQAWSEEQAMRKAEADADDLPRVLLKTTKGDIVVELFENQAPNTVANFIYLVKRGFYDGLSFHRVMQGFMAQGGDPNGNGSGGPGYSIACECYRPDARKHFRGSLSMAHAGRDTGGSQFFLTFMPTPHLDGKHTVFGRVISGMDVLAKLQRRDPNDAEAPRPDRILKAEVLRKRPHRYMPQKMPE